MIVKAGSEVGKDGGGGGQVVISGGHNREKERERENKGKQVHSNSHETKNSQSAYINLQSTLTKLVQKKLAR